VYLIKGIGRKTLDERKINRLLKRLGILRSTTKHWNYARFTICVGFHAEKHFWLKSFWKESNSRK